MREGGASVSGGRSDILPRRKSTASGILHTSPLPTTPLVNEASIFSPNSPEAVEMVTVHEDAVMGLEDPEA